MTIFTRPQWCIEPLRPQGGAATRRSSAASADFVGGHQSPDLRRPRGTVRSCDCMRGIGIAGTTTPLWWKRSCQGTA